MNRILATAVAFLIVYSASAQVSLDQAILLLEAGDFGGSIIVIDQLIAKDPHHASYYSHKTRCLVALTAFEDAMDALNVGIALMPDSAVLYNDKGTLLESFGLYPEAIREFTSASEKTDEPGLKSHILSNLGGAKYRTRDFQGGYIALMKAIELDSTNLDALNNIAPLCDEINRPEDGLMYLEKIIRINPNYAPAYINLGFKYQKLEKYEEAIEYFNKAIEIAPSEALSFSNRSFSKLKLKDLDGAMTDVNYSLELFPTNSFAYKIRALIKIEKKLTKEACTDLYKAIELGYSNQYGTEVRDLIEKNCRN